jgi:hypothetical protein
MTVELPEMRKSVIDAVGSLADVAYQKRVWVNRIYPTNGYYDDFTLNVNILFDDTLVLEDPYACVGSILVSLAEADSMVVLANSIVRLLDVEGRNRCDLDYLNSPLWAEVVSAAQNSYIILVANGGR